MSEGSTRDVGAGRRESTLRVDVTNRFGQGSGTDRLHTTPLQEAKPSVSKTIPSYLRIHRGPRREASQNPTAASDGLQQFWQAYTEATGWRVDTRRVRRGVDLTLLPAVVTDGMSGADDLDAVPPVSRSSAAQLARAATVLAKQLHRSQEAIRRQEAELATRAAVIASDEDRADLASRLEAILRDAATACRCDAAALYLLDDDTRYLTTRAVSGLPADRLGAAPRELRGSRADLEALVQEVVLIDEATAGGIDSWQFPEPFPAGVCASVNEGDLPIGTLWLFSNTPQSFAEPERAAARMASSHVATEIARAAATTNRLDVNTARVAIGDAAQWQYRTLPVSSELAPGWTADGMIESNQEWAIGWHTWDVLPDGSLVFALAEAVDRSMAGGMAAAIARAALTAHCGYRHTPKQLIQRVGDTLWQSNSGDQLLSLLYARVDPETGDGQIATAGKTQTMIASRYGYRPLADGRSEPLGTHIDTRPAVESFRLLPGEALLAYGDGLVADGANQQLLGEALRGAIRLGSQSPLAAIRRVLADRPLRHERGAGALVRE